MSSAYDIVMENRRELVRKVIDMMKQGYFFNAPEWDRAMLCPQNPLSKVRYTTQLEKYICFQGWFYVKNVEIH